MLNYFESLPAAVAQGIIWGIMAIGVYITYKILDIADLTVDGTICTGGAVCAVLVVSGQPVWLALIVSIIAGMLAGLLTGIFHTFMGIPAILSGILTQLILWSVNLKIMGGANQALPATKYNLLISRLNLDRSIIILEVVALVLIIILYWFFGTEFGASLRATGANLNMSRAQGINTSFTKIIGLVISNGIVALAGGLVSQYNGNASITMGQGAIVTGLAAVIIGEALFGWLCRNNFALKLIVVCIGGIIYYIVYNTVIFMGLDSDLLKMIAAILVAIFLAMPYWKKRYFSNAAHAEKKELHDSQKAEKKKAKGR
ncbi:MAG: ABC transporter permease [Ruminococcaceae bacterium]|nr:ABC transporter permease [Oscillospiraceae bacterium]